MPQDTGRPNAQKVDKVNPDKLNIEEQDTSWLAFASEMMGLSQLLPNPEVRGAPLEIQCCRFRGFSTG